MLWRTHLLAGVAAGLFLAGPHAGLQTAAVSAGMSGAAALLPDLDDPHSKVGRCVPLLSRTIKKAVGHRGPLHSLPGAAVVSLPAAFLALRFMHAYVPVPVDPFLLLPAGFISHLVMDSFNPQGVPWFWPVKKHFRVPLVHTGGLLEHVLVTPLMLIICGWLALPLLRAL